MVEVHNIKGHMYCEDMKIISQTPKTVIIEGLLLPKDKVSRNGVLYDWESIKSKHKELVGCPILFNHIHDTNQASFGKVTESWLKETEDADGPAGWYYKAQLDPESEYTKQVLKGFLSKVSIQLMASRAIEEMDSNGNSYQRAFIADPLEMSLVNIPGFKDTTIEVALAEAFKDKKKSEDGMSTASNPGASGTAMPGRREAYGKYDFSAEFCTGWAIEKEKSPSTPDEDIGQLVLNNLKSDKEYYNQHHDEELVKEFLSLGEDKIQIIMSEFNMGQDN
jgi:hypothetical protein